MLGSDEGWMANNNGLYISVDSGGTWLAVVAPSLKYEDPVTRMAGIGSDGPQGLWVSVFDAAMRPCVGGLCRGSAIDVSTDGGRSWTVSRLPGCVDCYPAVSMLGPHDGVTVADLDPGGTWTYETTDGGQSWRRAGMSGFPDLTVPVSATLSSVENGWLSSSSGQLFRTTDGGKAWHEVTIPTDVGERLIAVGVPRFFGMHVGAVVLEVDEPGTPGHYFGVAQTANGGDTWSVAPTPAETASIGASPATAATVLSASTWVLGTHEGVIETTDGGIKWPTIFDGRIDGSVAQTDLVSFASVQHGWALVSDDCRPQPSSTCTGRALLGTTDGGAHWSELVGGELG
jgi:photosystem II stability/assembly factor-like uncharacterized protein